MASCAREGSGIHADPSAQAESGVMPGAATQDAGSAGAVPEAAGTGVVGRVSGGAAGVVASHGSPASGAAGRAPSPAAGSGGATSPTSPAEAGAGGAASEAGSGAPIQGMAAGAGGAESAAGSDSSQPLPAPTIWLAGDSTVAKGNTPCPVGWGASLQQHFVSEAKVVNSAVGGRSVRTWLYDVQTTMDRTGECNLAEDDRGEPVLQERWRQMLDDMKAGDYLFIQFGINDSSATCPRHVGLEAFKSSYGMMAQAAKDRGAQPIFVTPVSSIACNGSSARGTRGAFVSATHEAGQEHDVPVVDLHARSVELYNTLGLCPIQGGGDVSASTGGKAGAFFCDDHTHFDRTGSEQIAKLMAEALEEQGFDLAAYLR